MATITISRQFGAGGATLGERLSKRLGYRYVSDHLIREVAKNIGISLAQVRRIEKIETSKLMKLFEKIINTNIIERQIPKKYRPLDEKRLVEEVKTVIRKLHDEDNVVIVGRGGNYALKDDKDIIHILLVASMEHRIKFLTDKYRMSKKQAERAINRADAIRYAFLDYFSEGGNHDDPLLYTMVLNMDQVSMEKAEDLVVGLIL